MINLIEEEASMDNREFPAMVEILIAESIYHRRNGRKFSIRDFK